VAEEPAGHWELHTVEEVVAPWRPVAAPAAITAGRRRVPVVDPVEHCVHAAAPVVAVKKPTGQAVHTPVVEAVATPAL